MSPATQRRRRSDLRYALAMAAALAVVLWVVMTFQSQNEKLAAEYEARDALARQVQDLGGKPVAGEPGSRGDPGLPGVQGPRGPRGYPGERGPRGFQGERGPVGSAGKDGDRGVAGPSGPPGAAGASGQDGAPGSPGQPGERGEKGDPGERGEKGDRGEQGPPPSGWSWTGPDGTDYECTRDADESTHYTCQPTSQPEPSPSEQPPGLLGIGLLTSVPAYRRGVIAC